LSSSQEGAKKKIGGNFGGDEIVDFKLISGIIVAFVVINGGLYISYQDDYNKMDQLDREISQNKTSLDSLDKKIKAGKSDIDHKETQRDNMKVQLDDLETQMDSMDSSQYNKNVDYYCTFQVSPKFLLFILSLYSYF